MNPWYCCNLDTCIQCIHYITIKISHMDMAYLSNILLIISVNKKYILMSRKGDRKGIWVILKVLLFLWQTFLDLVWSGVASENWLVKKNNKKVSYHKQITCQQLLCKNFLSRPGSGRPCKNFSHCLTLPKHAETFSTIWYVTMPNLVTKANHIGTCRGSKNNSECWGPPFAWTMADLLKHAPFHVC